MVLITCWIIQKKGIDKVMISLLDFFLVTHLDGCGQAPCATSTHLLIWPNGNIFGTQSSLYSAHRARLLGRCCYLNQLHVAQVFGAVLQLE